MVLHPLKQKIKGANSYLNVRKMLEQRQVEEQFKQWVKGDN